MLAESVAHKNSDMVLERVIVKDPWYGSVAGVARA